MKRNQLEKEDTFGPAKRPFGGLGHGVFYTRRGLTSTHVMTVNFRRPPKR